MDQQDHQSSARTERDGKHPAPAPQAGGNPSSSGLQPGGTLPGKSPGAGVGSIGIGTGGGATGGSGTGNAG